MSVTAAAREKFGVIAGTGNMMTPDLPRLMRIIRDGGYRGYVPIETLAATGRPYDADVVVAQFAAEVRTAMAGH